MRRPSGWLLGVELEDSAAFSKTLDKVLALTNVTPKKRQFENTTIYEFEIPAMQNAERGRGPGRTDQRGDRRDHLFLSHPASILEQVIRGGGPALAETPAYRAVAEHFPKASSTQSFTRSEEQARVLYKMIQSGQLNDAIKEAARNAGGEVPDEAFIDPAKLPDFSVFQKYISQSGGFGVMEPDGVSFTQFTLKKETP